jgi:hypothetical protein
MADEVVYILATMEPREGKKEEVRHTLKRYFDNVVNNGRYRSSTA